MHWLLLPRPAVLLKVPSKQGSAADAPSRQNEPGEHSTQAVMPVSAWNRPASHLAQLPCSASGCTVPGLHSVGVAEPVEQNEPDGQPMQSSEELMKSRSPFWKRPDGHGSPADAPSVQYSPPAQSRHDVAPGLPMNLPASHFWHEPCVVLGCTLPGLHSVGAVAPVEQKAPAGHVSH